MATQSYRDPTTGEIVEQHGNRHGAAFVLRHYPPNEDDVTPSDTTTFEPSMVQSIDGGDVTYVTAGGQERTRTLEAGEWIPAMVVQVKATGTDSAELVRVW